MERKLIPYSVYLPIEQHEKLREAAQHRKAATIVRQAIEQFLSGKNSYDAGYVQGLKDAAQVVYDCPEAQMVAVRGKDIGAVLKELIESLGAKK